MLENDTHALGSVDRVLAETMVRLCADTAEYLYTEYSPTLARYEKGSRPLLEGYVADAVAFQGTSVDRAARIVDFCQSLGERAPDDLDEMRFGGTEEQIIVRGSDWCTDVARVACAMCHMAGVPARLISLFNLSQAYSGHAIIEAFTEGVWGAADPLNGVVYRHPNGRPATTWELMNDDRLVLGNWQRQSSFYANPRQFEAAAVCNYSIGQASDFDYTVSTLNDYNRPFLRLLMLAGPAGYDGCTGRKVSNRHTSASIHSGRRRSTEGQGGYHQDRADYRAIAVLSAWAEGLSIVGHGSSESVSISLTPSTPLHFAQVRLRPFPSRERGPLTCWRACLWIIERL